MYRKLARHLGGSPLRAVIVWLFVVGFCLAAALTGLGGKPLFERLHTGLPEVPASESQRGDKILRTVAKTEYKVQAMVQGVDFAADMAAAKDARHIIEENKPIAEEKAAKAEALGKEAQELGAQAQAIGQELALSRGSFTPEQMAGKMAKAQELGAKAQEVGAQAQAVGMEAQAAGQKATDAAATSFPAAEKLAAALDGFHKEVEKMPGVTRVISPVMVKNAILDENAAKMVSRAGKDILFVVEADISVENTGSAAESVKWRQAIEKKLGTLPGVISAAGAGNTTVTVSDGDLVEATAMKQLSKDLIKAETIGLPLSLIVMILVFGGLLAAAMPLAGAGVSIAGALAVLLAMTYVQTQESFVVNVITILGLGLSIDYGLLIVSRYKEELRNLTEEDGQAHRQKLLDAGVSRKLLRRDPRQVLAMETTLMTAGRTAVFSGVTVVLSTCSLLVFSPYLLKSLGVGGIVVILIAIISAITLVPALLYLAGDRISNRSALTKLPGIRKLNAVMRDRHSSKGAFSALARTIHHRPWAFLVVATGVVLAFTVPVGHLHMKNSVIELLPLQSDQRVYLDTVNEDFDGVGWPGVTVLAKTSPEEANDWAQAELTKIPEVKSVRDAHQIGQWSAVSVDLNTLDAGSREAMNAVDHIRAVEHPFEVLTAGQAANQTDFTSALMHGAPWAALILVLATFLILFLMTGSVIIPLQALLINSVSLIAALGVTTWIFQDGHFERLLAYKSAGGIESYVVTLVICFGFGLAMDYEVFLISRIKEVWDETGDNAAAVEIGLQRSGRIITSAALILVFVFLGFVSGEMLAIKQIGMALAIMIIVDATIVRLLLVPAAMTIFGKWNWWAPAPLRRLHQRFHITH